MFSSLFFEIDLPQSYNCQISFSNNDIGSARRVDFNHSFYIHLEAELPVLQDPASLTNTSPGIETSSITTTSVADAKMLACSHSQFF